MSKFVAPNKYRSGPWVLHETKECADLSNANGTREVEPEIYPGDWSRLCEHCHK